MIFVIGSICVAHFIGYILWDRLMLLLLSSFAVDRCKKTKQVWQIWKTCTKLHTEIEYCEWPTRNKIIIILIVILRCVHSAFPIHLNLNKNRNSLCQISPNTNWITHRIPFKCILNSKSQGKKMWVQSIRNRDGILFVLKSDKNKQQQYRTGRRRKWSDYCERFGRHFYFCFRNEWHVHQIWARWLLFASHQQHANTVQTE